MFKEILGTAFPIIEKVAPILASVLGSPMGGLAASWAMSAVANKFGLDPADIPKISDAIVNDTESESKLSDLEKTVGQFFGSINWKAPSSIELNLKVEFPS